MNATRACLGSEELQRVVQAGHGPLAPDLAAHLAECGACQTRLLALDLPARSSTPTRPNELGGLLMRAGLVLLVILVALGSMLLLAR